MGTGRVYTNCSRGLYRKLVTADEFHNPGN